MDLHVILGPPGAGKAARATAALRAAAEAGRDAFLCVPGAVDRSRFLRELAGGTGDGDGGERSVLIGAEVGTFDQLLARIAGSPPVRRTDRAMERIVVRDALRDVPAFAAAARWSGFVETARRHVDQLRRARVWGQSELERVERDLPGGGVATWHALEDRVGAILRERRLRDDAWFERRAANALRAGTPGVEAVVVYGFETLPPARVELLERLANVVPVTVSLNWRPGRRVHERAADLRDRWRARGAFIETVDGTSHTHPMLGWLGDELFEDHAGREPPRAQEAPGLPAPIAFVDCCGPLQEAEEVVREVARLAGNGFAWDDIAVASADASHDGELLVAAFERAGIPARVQAHRTAVDVPAGRALHELLDAVAHRDALRIVAALRAPVFALDPARVDAAEVVLRGARHAARDAFTHPAVRRVVPEAVTDLLDASPARPQETLDGVRALIGTLLPTDVGELDLLRGVAALLEGLSVAAGGPAGVGIGDVRDAIGTFPLTVPDRSDSGAVVIASIEDLRSIAYDAVVLRGMHASGFRARVEEDVEAPAAGRDLLYLAVTRARRTIRVVRQAAGSDGGHLAPSPAWQELRRLAPDAPCRARRLGSVVVDPADVLLDVERAPAVALATGAGRDVDAVPEAIRASVQAHCRHARREQLEGAALERVAGIRQLAVTAVERYAVCSAKWFIESMLRAADPDDDRSRLVEGLVAHALLQRLVPRAWDGQDPDSLRTQAMAALPELSKEIDPRRLLDAARLERIVEHVLVLVEAESSWERPDRIEVERAFGREADDSFGPGYDVGDVEVVGRIDRIDHHGSRVVLHDYKYGATDRPAKELIESRNLQLLVYWLAMQQPGSAVEPIGAIYRAVTKGGAPSGVLSPELREIGVVGPRVRAGVLDEEARSELLEEAAALVSMSVEGIRSGRVAPLDDPARCPEHCRLQHICRIGEGRR